MEGERWWRGGGENGGCGPDIPEVGESGRRVGVQIKRERN